MYSGIDVPSYRLEPVNFDSTTAPVRLRESLQNHTQVVAGFAPVLLGKRAIDPGYLYLHFDGFVGTSVTNPLDNLYLGITGNVNGLAMVHVGYHIGKVEAIREGAPIFDVEELPHDYDLMGQIEDDWRASWFVGVSIDAASASMAFANGILGLLKR